jgi:hypothetical protein
MKHLLALVGLLYILCLSSCLKAKCTGNCINTIFKGRIYDATIKRGFGGIKVRMIWSNQSQSYLYPEVTTVKTNQEGWFEINVKINPDNFNNKTLNIQFEAPDGYELRGNLDGNDFFSDESFYSYNPTAFQQMDFRLYPVTTAKVKMVRLQSDLLKKTSLSYSFNNEYPTHFGDVFSNFNQDYEYQIYTAADIYTVVKLEKTLTSGVIISTSDSAIFKRNQVNTLQINY